MKQFVHAEHLTAVIGVVLIHIAVFFFLPSVARPPREILPEALEIIGAVIEPQPIALAPSQAPSQAPAPLPKQAPSRTITKTQAPIPPAPLINEPTNVETSKQSAPTVEPAAAPTAPPTPVASTPTAPVSTLAPTPAPVETKQVALKAEPKLELPRGDVDYLNNPSPVYPPVSRRLGEYGRVSLRALVGIDGLVQRIELKTSSGHERLDGAALATVRAWRFKPGTRDGVPVELWVAIPIDFKLN